MHRAITLFAFSLCVVGCVSEAERYERNRTHVFVCPRARRLTQSDLDQISRLVAHSTSLLAVLITPPAGDNSLNKLLVSTRAWGAENSDNSDCYGSCTVLRDGSRWRLTECVTGVSPSLWQGLGCMP